MRKSRSFLFVATSVITFLSGIGVAKASAPAEVPKLSAPEIQFLAASAALETAENFGSKKLDGKLRNLLLNEARPEDKGYAKDLIVRWKPIDAVSIEADFDTLVLRDAQGFQATRIKATSADGSFLINGREWRVPTEGSVVKSLRSHLVAGQDSARFAPNSRRIFATILSPSEAFAADEPASLAPTYVYVQKYGASVRRIDPYSYAQTSSPSRIAKEIVPFLYFFSKEKSGPPEVTCDASTAKGRGVIGNSKVGFESRADGTLILTLENEARTKLRVTSFTKKNDSEPADKLAKLERFKNGNGQDKALSDELVKDLFYARAATRSRVFVLPAKDKMSVAEMDRRLPPSPYEIARLNYYYKSLARFEITDKMTVQECANADCTTYLPEASSSAKPWLVPESKIKPPLPTVRWTPMDSNREAAKIVWQKVDDNPVAKIIATTPLSGRDLAAAEAEVDRLHATLYPDLTPEQLKIEREYKTGMAALRPLGAFCGAAACRVSLNSKGINLKPASGGATKQ